MQRFHQFSLTTDRLTTAYYHWGEENEKKLLLVHGNLSSSVFFLPLLPELSKHYDVVIPDLRCFGDSDELPIDATRGYRDWSDDLAEFTSALGWDRFSLLGWSLGGNISMQFAIDHPDRLERLILLAPGSPFGIGGVRGRQGIAVHPIGLGSGAGCVNPQLLGIIAGKNKSTMKLMMQKFYFHSAFDELEEEVQDLLAEGIGKTKMGYDKYPGSFHHSFLWPFIVAGRHGVMNTMSPAYGNLSDFVNISKKIPVLWIRGVEDEVVSDHSLFDIGYLGSIGIIPGWPGNEIFPIQPMIKQMRYLLDQYAASGGKYREAIIRGGHACHLEDQKAFLEEVRIFMEKM